MKYLDKKVNDCVQHIILQKFTIFHAIRSWNFHNICNEIGWPVALFLLRHPVGLQECKLEDPIDTRKDNFMKVALLR